MTPEQTECTGHNPAKQHRSVLVTGGAGFIGSHLVEALLARGDLVTIIDDFSTGQRNNLPSQHHRLNVVEGTVGNSLNCMDNLFDEIYHLAAAVGVKLVVDEPIRTIETNVLETSAILRFASLNKTPTLLASTSEVYGKSTAIPMKEDGDLVFGETAKSRWSYGCSKALDEHLAMAWHRREGLPVRIPRFFNTIGSRQLGSWGMVVPRFIEAALENKPLVVYGDGSQTRCFCDVLDTVPMLLDLMDTDASIGVAVNVGSDVPMTILELAQLIKEVINSNSTIESLALEQAYGDGFEDLQDRQPDLSRLISLIGVRSRIPMHDTIITIANTIALGVKQE
ncbi:GDP-mannose 4,6-dehydratase [PVC group bacterium]|nr:GDP-mannose 4,6-dehydratase [PVC group bacterium]